MSHLYTLGKNTSLAFLLDVLKLYLSIRRKNSTRELQLLCASVVIN